MSKKCKFIIGLVGLPGAGKTTVAGFLGQKGYRPVTLSDLIKEEAAQNGISEFTREILQNYGNQMRQEYGPDILARLAIKKINKQHLPHTVIDGIRNPAEIAYLKARDGFALLGIVAPVKVRYLRLAKAKGHQWVGSYTNFLRQESREERLGKKEIGLRVKECLKKADYQIDNRGSLDELYQKLIRIIQKLDG